MVSLDLRLGFPLRPPCLHPGRQFLPHGCAHRLATRILLGDGCTFLGSRFTFLLCPPGLLCCRDSGACSRAHAALRATCRFTFATFGWTAAAGRSGTESRKCCDRLLESTSFLPELCHYALNVHVHPFVDCGTVLSYSRALIVGHLRGQF